MAPHGDAGKDAASRNDVRDNVAGNSLSSSWTHVSRPQSAEDALLRVPSRAARIIVELFPEPGAPFTGDHFAAVRFVWRESTRPRTVHGKGGRDDPSPEILISTQVVLHARAEAFLEPEEPSVTTVLLDAGRSAGLRRAPGRRALEIAGCCHCGQLRETGAPHASAPRTSCGDRKGTQNAHEGGGDTVQIKRVEQTGRDPDPQGAGPEHGRQADAISSTSASRRPRRSKVTAY